MRHTPNKDNHVYWVGQPYTGGAIGKEPTCQCRRRKRCGFDPWVGKILWRRAWQPTPVFLPGESHGQRSLAGWSMGSQDWTHISEFARTHIHHLRSVKPCAGPLANKNSFQPYNGLGVMIITKLQMRENWAQAGYLSSPGSQLINDRAGIQRPASPGPHEGQAQRALRSVEERAPPDNLWLAWLVPSNKHSKQLIQAPSYQ